jgi:hypothetical protein
VSSSRRGSAERKTGDPPDDDALHLQPLPSHSVLFGLGQALPTPQATSVKSWQLWLPDYRRQLHVKQRTKAWVDFAAFCAVLALLLMIHSDFHSLYGWFAIIWPCVFLALGVSGLARTIANREHALPTLVGVLPKSWRRWILGESDERRS